jgi:hypothetical protein
MARRALARTLGGASALQVLEMSRLELIEESRHEMVASPVASGARLDDPSS